MKLLLSIVLCSFYFSVSASRPDGPILDPQDNYLRYDDYVYQEYIETVLIYNKKDSLGFPMLRLGAGGQMILHFDDLVGDFQRYSYTFVHCNYDWTPSQLNKQEYLNGYNDNFIWFLNPETISEQDSLFNKFGA